MADSQNLEVAGYYSASENFYETTVDKAPAGKIADKIQEYYKNACFIVIDNSLVCQFAEKPAIKLYSCTESGKWSKDSFTLSQKQTTLEVIADLIKRGAMKHIVDFDNHLDCPELDWTNQHLNKDLKQILAMY